MGLTFLYPSLLWGLLALPAFYLLIRLLPPRPQAVDFPAINLLKKLSSRLPPPRTPPWWLLLLRLLLIALFIIGLSHPMLSRDSVQLGKEPLVIFVDNGWKSAQNWSLIYERLLLTLQQAQTNNTKVLVQGTADPINTSFVAATTALKELPTLAPRPWQSNSVEIAQQIAATLKNQNTVRPLWLSSGLMDEFERKAFITKSESIGRTRVFVPPQHHLPLMIEAIEPKQGAFKVELWRAGTSGEHDVSVSLYDVNGTFITRKGGQFNAGEQRETLTITLPKQLNTPGYFKIDRQQHIGAWWGVSTIAGLPKVGIIAPTENDFPLLSGEFYLNNALAETLKPQKLEATAQGDGFDVLLLTTQPTNIEQLDQWTKEGGVLITFAGDWLEKNRTVDNLLPIRLRPHPRQLTGALSWTGSLKIKGVNPESPIKALVNKPLPDDVNITTQFLPETAANLANNTWVSLNDDTPLVTGQAAGNGWKILVHVPADASWSSLPLSGFFVDLLNTLINLKQKDSAVSADYAFPLPAHRILTAQGELISARSGEMVEAVDNPINVNTPAGLYGNQRAPFVHQLSAEQRLESAITPSNLDGLTTRYYDEAEKHKPLHSFVLALALLLLAIDSLLRVNFIHKKILRKVSTTTAMLLLASLGFSLPAYAEPFPAGAHKIQFAWVDTGNSTLNTIAKQGLTSLSYVLANRTTVEPVAPVMVNPATDDLGFYPILFWSVPPNLGKINKKATENLRLYIENGGLLVIDTLTDIGSSAAAGKIILNHILPMPLGALRDDHVINRSYYLLRGKTPGRADGSLWVETTRHLPRLIVGNHDWLGAWAHDENGTPRRAVTPGGEQQRSLAFRFGINLVMYALLGDYKADQLHVNTLLKRMEER